MEWIAVPISTVTMCVRNEIPLQPQEAAGDPGPRPTDPQDALFFPREPHYGSANTLTQENDTSLAHDLSGGT
jgi:hypothetical protein